MAAYLVELEEVGEADRERVGRTFRDRFHPLDSLSDEQLCKKYRFSRQGIMRISDLIGASLQHETGRNFALSSTLQVLVALNFYATGAVLDSVATIHGVHRSTVSRVIHNVANALCRQKNNVSIHSMQ